MRDFEEGLEVCSRPWSIKIKTNDPTGLAVGCQAIRDCLTVGGPTCHPILAPPSTIASCQKAVARKEMVFAHQLAIAFRASSARHRLQPVAHEVWHENTCRRSLWQTYELQGDFRAGAWALCPEVLEGKTHGLWYPVLSMHPTLVCPMKNFHELNWADWPASPWQGRSSLPKADIVFGEMDSSTTGNWNACFFCP